MVSNQIPSGKIIMPFKKLTDSLLASKGQEIYASMLNNPSFATPTPDMPTLLSVLNNYTASLATAQTRERTAIIIKNQNRALLIDLLKAMGTYVTFTAQGDASQLSTTGFDMGKTRSKSPDIDKPLAPALTDGANSGEMVSSADGVKRVKSYVHQYKANLITGDTDWTNIFSTSRTSTLSGLITGQRYTVRIGAIGTNNQVVYSDTVSRIAQ